jgi:putative heme-binding domain-containing protein
VTNRADTVPEPTRVSAVRLLGAWDQPAGGEVLGAVLRSPGLASLHDPAVEALARSRRPETAGRLLGAWETLAPSVRGRVLTALLARPEWTGELVGALEKDRIRPAELSAAQRQSLLGSRHPGVAKRAGKVLAAAQPGSRTEALQRYTGVASLTGASAHGMAVFDQQCASCHALRGRGHDVGPNLAEFAGKSVPDFLLAILDPNAGLNPNFLAYTVETKDGRSLLGLVRNETASGLILVQGGGVRESVLRQDIASLRASSISLMPEGLEAAMTPQDVADLIAWIRAARPAAFGQASAEQAAGARAEFVRGGLTNAFNVTRAVEHLPYPGWLGRWPLAYCRQQAGQDRLQWKAAARPAGADRAVFRFPAAMGFQSQAAGGFTLRLNGQALLQFEVALDDREWTSADGRAQLRYAVKEASGEDSCGVLEIEVPAALAKPGATVDFEVMGAAAGSQRWFGLYVVDFNRPT